jgi:predicted ATPase
MTDDKLRSLLSRFYRFHTELERKRFELRAGQRDIFARLNQLYHQIFPQRQLLGSIPKMGPNDIFDEVEEFWLSVNRQEYELGGMSGGERATFPLLVDFANWNINNSIILIDEIELHLHPPLQQALIRSLPSLGQNNQFILTTHSDYVASLFQEHQIIRL